MGFFRVNVEIESFCSEWVSPVQKLLLAKRISSCATHAGVGLVAFGFSTNTIRVVLSGQRAQLTNYVRGLKVGSSRVLKGRIEWGVSTVSRADGRRVHSLVAWAHRAPIEGTNRGPLSSQWSSHRDLMGYRHSAFFKRTEIHNRLGMRTVHRLANGYPAQLSHIPQPGFFTLSTLMKLAAAVKGVLPADPHSYSLFVQLARLFDFSTTEISKALCLTTRRIRQLASADEPLFSVGVLALRDQRLWSAGL